MRARMMRFVIVVRRQHSFLGKAVRLGLTENAKKEASEGLQEATLDYFKARDTVRGHVNTPTHRRDEIRPKLHQSFDCYPGFLDATQSAILTSHSGSATPL